ncbi:translation initiation factor IF-2, partial [Candidatus Poribacteria bacterium]|nr:translation initiation factor IF-2 [Candidatus Poribacteria bacterium]
MADEGGKYEKPMRVNQLAKDVGASNKELIAWLQDKGHDIKTHSNSVPPEVAGELAAAFGKAADPAAAKAKPKPKPADKPAPEAEVEVEAPAAEADATSPAEEAPTVATPAAAAPQGAPPRREVRTVRRVDTRSGPRGRSGAAGGRGDRTTARRPPTPQEARAAREAQALRDGKRILRSARPAPEPAPEPAAAEPTAPATPTPRRPTGPKRRISTLGGSLREESRGAPGAEGGGDDGRRAAYSTRGEGRDGTRTYHSDRGRRASEPGARRESTQGGPRGGAGGPQGARRGPTSRFAGAGAPRPVGAGRGAAPRTGRGAGGPTVAPPRADEDTVRAQERRRLDKERERAREELLELAEERDEEILLDDLPGRTDADGVVLPVRDEPVEISEGSTVAVVAETLGVKASLIIGHMFQMGAMVTINDSLPMEVLEQLQEPFTFTAVKRESVEDQLLQKIEIDSEDTLVQRAPVVTIMGHVDHGKTSLLDAVRKTNVADREAGSITQHIGAYDVRLPNGRVVFLDTPGHAAFTAMRARGAHVTDVVVLVVAADDGVMPQTVEAINHARAAEVPIVVAVNKIDVASANPDNVRNGLSAHDLMPEEWGGTTVFQNVSALTGEGIPELLEYLSLESELLELRANPDRMAAGTVVEAQLSRGRGPVATVLVQNGTLKVGDYFVAGAASGRVRALIDDHGER